MENTWTRGSNKERKDFYKKVDSQITKDMEVTIGSSCTKTGPSNYKLNDKVNVLRNLGMKNGRSFLQFNSLLYLTQVKK